MIRLCLLVTLALLTACDQTSDTWQGYVEGENLLIAAPVSGKLQTLAVTEGDKVDAAQHLFTLDPEPETSALTIAQAQADAAAAELADLQKGSRPEELAVIEAQFAQAKAAADLSAQQRLRIRSLVERNLEGQEALDEAATKHESNVKRMEELQAQLKTARLAARTDRVKAAEARLRAAEAEVKRVNWQLLEKTQNAPQAAKVREVLFRPGEFVAAGQPVVSLLPPARVKIRFFIPEPRLPEVEEGQIITINCDGCEQAISATVRYISPQAEFTPPFIYSKENRQKFVYLAEAWPAIEDAEALHPGQPVDIRLVDSQQ